MTWLYVALFFGMASDDFRTRDASFRALRDLPQSRRAIAVWTRDTNLELAMRHKALEKYWQATYLPYCPHCQEYCGIDNGLIPSHAGRPAPRPSPPATRPGGIFGPIIVLGPAPTADCPGSSQAPIYKKR